MPLSTDRYRLQVTIDGETLEMFHLATDMLGHAIPDGNPAAVLNRAFKALLSELARKKFAETSSPRPARADKPGARSPSAAVRLQTAALYQGRSRSPGPEERPDHRDPVTVSHRSIRNAATSSAMAR
jgi:hypothetical protein